MSSDHLPEEVVDFLPDALEIKNAVLPRSIRFCIWMPIIVVSLILIWSYFARVDIVIQGNSHLVTDCSTIVMKPLERSVIKKINVKIGDIVHKNQVLITFDPVINQAEAERLHSEKMALSAQLERLTAEFYGKDFQPAKDQFQQWQEAIFIQRKKYYQERMNYFAEASAQVDVSRKSSLDSLNKQRERLAAMQKLEHMFQSLQKSGSVSLKDLIQISISRMEMELVTDQLSNSLLELHHRSKSILAEKKSFIQEWRNTIAENMVKIDLQLTSVNKDYAKISQLIEYVTLRAPCEAMVHEIAAFSPGSAVREAEALITLIPLEGNIELETEIRPQDIGKISLGAEARVKLSAYPFQKYGTLHGLVRNISENTLRKEMNGQTVTYYRARLSIDGKLRNVHEDFRLIPGMEAQCEIKCGRRRIIEYFVYPLIKGLKESIREP